MSVYENQQPVTTKRLPVNDGQGKVFSYQEKALMKRSDVKMPVGIEKFQKLDKVPKNKTAGHGRKVDWAKFRDWLQKNKEFAYTVKEAWEYVKAHCMIEQGTTISRVRVYKEIKKYVKKGIVEERFDEGDIGVYNWKHIQKVKEKAK